MEALLLTLKAFKIYLRMTEQANSSEKIGNILAALGGLLVVLNFTFLSDSVWGLELSILAIALVFGGIYFLNKK